MLELHRVAEPPLHALVDDPETADMILFVAGWQAHGEGVADSPLPKKYPDKCFIYFDDDGFVPLLPGIYTNAEKLWGIDLGRTESHMFIDALNPNVAPIPNAEKKYLFSFAGGSTSLLRKKLYKIDFGREDVLVRNTSDYYHWDPSQEGRAARQKEYAETIASSHFGLCPRGASAGGLRLFEVMQMGVAPVMISDRFRLPVGPDWSKFLIDVPETRIKDLPQILEPLVGESAERGRLARQAWEQYFSPPAMFNGIVAACVRAKERRKISERWIQPFWGFMLWRRRMYNWSRAALKSVVLWVFKLMGRKFVYDLNTR
uniref:Exostosin family protein n=1 Tax=uncultured bacterium 162 TaxID=698381 RepID=E3T753_9BACT|nr:exostosin family protein [uncultured bacterium 162]